MVSLGYVTGLLEPQQTNYMRCSRTCLCSSSEQEIGAGRVGANKGVELPANSRPKLFQFNILARRLGKSPCKRLKVDGREVDGLVASTSTGGFSSDEEAVSRNRTVELALISVMTGLMSAPGDVTLHTLRHTAISQMIASGFDDHTVKGISGHKPTRMLERYTHPTDEHN